jgi:hypothetical protein
MLAGGVGASPMLKVTAKQAVAQGAIRAVRIGDIDRFGGNTNAYPTNAQDNAAARWVAAQPHTIKLLHCKYGTNWEVSWKAATMRHVGWSRSDIAGGTSYFTHSADGGTWGTPGC